MRAGMRQGWRTRQDNTKWIKKFKRRLDESWDETRRGKMKWIKIFKRRVDESWDERREWDEKRDELCLTGESSAQMSYYHLVSWTDCESSGWRLCSRPSLTISIICTAVNVIEIKATDSLNIKITAPSVWLQLDTQHPPQTLDEDEAFQSKRVEKQTNFS